MNDTSQYFFNQDKLNKIYSIRKLQIYSQATNLMCLDWDTKLRELIDKDAE